MIINSLYVLGKEKQPEKEVLSFKLFSSILEI